jgi:hypothetical protein
VIFFVKVLDMIWWFCGFFFPVCVDVYSKKALPEEVFHCPKLKAIFGVVLKNLKDTNRLSQYVLRFPAKVNPNSKRRKKKVLLRFLGKEKHFRRDEYHLFIYFTFKKKKKRLDSIILFNIYMIKLCSALNWFLNYYYFVKLK